MKMSLDDLLNEMREKMKNRDLSDDYLKKHGNPTRGEIGIGEYSYGITMVPCEWVYKYLFDYIREIDDREVSDALHMLLHCSLKYTEYETQKQQFEIVNAYIKKLEKENEELKHKYDVFVRMSSDIIANSIPTQKIEDKIEELKSYKGLVIYERCNYESQIKTLQDLLESEGK